MTQAYIAIGRLRTCIYIQTSWFARLQIHDCYCQYSTKFSKQSFRCRCASRHKPSPAQELEPEAPSPEGPFLTECRHCTCSSNVCPALHTTQPLFPLASSFHARDFFSSLSGALGFPWRCFLVQVLRWTPWTEIKRQRQLHCFLRQDYRDSYITCSRATRLELLGVLSKVVHVKPRIWGSLSRLAPISPKLGLRKGGYNSHQRDFDVVTYSIIPGSAHVSDGEVAFFFNHKP